ncbi:MAG: mycothiol synthase [Ilumatobacteraceae bacterium]
MPVLETTRDLSTVSDEMVGLVETVGRAAGRRPVSDQLWIDLMQGGRPGSLAVVARGPDGRLVGAAQASSGNETTVMQIVLDPAERLDTLGVELVRRATTETVRDGATHLTWWVAEPSPAHHAIAGALGWRAERELLQMRRALPTDAPVEIETRPFRPGVDDEAWIEVNNRAFASHGEQGGWDLETLRQRMTEPWFDPEGFLVHEIGGRMVGFCWTKVHDEGDPVEGEIYVIAVDPDFHGRGLGAQLTLAGLDSIARRGIDVGMLFVDAANTAAVALYEKLGFTVHRTDVAFVRG